MKKALLLGACLAFVVIVLLPLLVGNNDTLRPGFTGGGNAFLTPDYAKRLGLREVSRETFRSCQTALSYEEVVLRLGVPGVRLQNKEDLPPIPFDTMISIWGNDIDHPEREVYGWVSTYGEVMTMTFLNGKIVHVYYGQGQGPEQ